MSFRMDDITGEFDIAPPLNLRERTLINNLADPDTQSLGYDPHVEFGDLTEVDLSEFGWHADPDGTKLVWSGLSQFPHPLDCLNFLIHTFLADGAAAQGHSACEEFTFDHVVNGEVEVEDEYTSYRITVCDNDVERHVLDLDE